MKIMPLDYPKTDSRNVNRYLKALSIQRACEVALRSAKSDVAVAYSRLTGKQIGLAKHITRGEEHTHGA